MIKMGDKFIIKDNIISERLNHGKFAYPDLMTKYIGKQVVVWESSEKFIITLIEDKTIVIPISAIATISEVRASKIRSLNIL